MKFVGVWIRPGSSVACRRRGFTLLELLIAVGLMSILIAALFSAMSIYVELRLDGHEEITRQQIARTLLRQMTRDVQSVVFVKQDTVDDESDSFTGSSGNSSGSGSSSGLGSAGSGSTGSGSTSGAGSTGSGTGGSGSLAGSGSTAATGGSSGLGSASIGGGGSSSSVDAATSAMTTYTNGLVGTADDLLLYVSRPDKDLSYVAAQSLSSLSERSSDLMIIRYLVADTGAGGLSGQIADQFAQGRDGAVGLVRITGDMFGLSTAIESGTDEEQPLVDSVEAPEVSKIQFRYFDGVDWLETWDSTQLNQMPTAIEVRLTLRNAPGSAASLDDDDDPYAMPETTHRMVIPVPVSEPFVVEASL